MPIPRPLWFPRQKSICPKCMADTGVSIKGGKVLREGGKVNIAVKADGCDDCCQCPDNVELTFANITACGCFTQTLDIDITTVQDINGTHTLPFDTEIGGGTICRYRLSRSSTGWAVTELHSTNNASCGNVTNTQSFDTQFMEVTLYKADLTIQDLRVGILLGDGQVFFSSDVAPAPGLALDVAHNNQQTCAARFTFSNDGTGLVSIP